MIAVVFILCTPQDAAMIHNIYLNIFEKQNSTETALILYPTNTARFLLAFHVWSPASKKDPKQGNTPPSSRRKKRTVLHCTVHADLTPSTQNHNSVSYIRTVKNKIFNKAAHGLSKARYRCTSS